jgi:hypothetical protein
MTELSFGYVPKDIAYSLSQIIEAPHIFIIDEPVYDQKKDLISVQFTLQNNILRDKRPSKSIFQLTQFTCMPRDIRIALNAL